MPTATAAGLASYVEDAFGPVKREPRDILVTRVRAWWQTVGRMDLSCRLDLQIPGFDSRNDRLINGNRWAVNHVHRILEPTGRP